MSKDQWEEQRDAMYWASIKNVLYHEKEVKKVELVPFTFEEFKTVMIQKSPVMIYNTMWSEKKDFYRITKMISPSDDGVWMYCQGSADKTPKLWSWQGFYRHVKSNGIEHIKF